MAETVDVVVVGMGPGGEALVGSLAEAGLRVVGIERELVGGECPYWGCVPTKMMIRASNLLMEGRQIRGIAGDAEVRPDWSPEATDNWDDKCRRSTLRSSPRHSGGRKDGSGRIKDRSSWSRSAGTA